VKLAAALADDVDIGPEQADSLSPAATDSPARPLRSLCGDDPLDRGLIMAVVFGFQGSTVEPATLASCIAAQVRIARAARVIMIGSR